MGRLTAKLVVVAVACAAGAIAATAEPAAEPSIGLSAPARLLLLAQAQKPATQPPAAQPTQVQPQAQQPQPEAKGVWPKTLPEPKAEADAKANPPAVATAWTPAEITLAQARCTVLLKTIDAVAIPEPGMRNGECGAPAPVRLVSIGKKPEVALSPPPLVTCDMAVALHTWIKGDVQPLARKHLGADVIKIETMSDYSCRTAYGRAKNRLSEHGKANALDIRGFTTAKGDTAILLDDWGLTERDLAAQVAAAKAAAEREAAARAAAAAAAKTPPQPATAGSALPAPSQGLAKSTIIDGVPRVTLTLPGGAPAATGSTGPGSTGIGLQPNRLGGPKPGATAAIPSAAPAAPAAVLTNKSRFLREAHTAACRIFGTTLGPEANNAHRNHFHVDMAERRSSNFCE